MNHGYIMKAGDKGKMKKAKHQKRNCMFGILFAAAVCMTAGCSATVPAEDGSQVFSFEEQESVKLPEAGGETEYLEAAERKEPEGGVEAEPSFEEEWYRTDVASYQWARIKISNWKEGESFRVTLDAIYFPYSGTIEGTATFIEPNMAVLYDENVESFLQKDAGDHGIYFQFLEDSIIVTHENDVRPWFGGGGIATAEGTYIQGEPEYTNCTDVRKIFTEEELAQIQELLGDSYAVLFEEVIELGEVEEFAWDGGRLWKAYRPHVGAEWCNIVIYDDGRIYIQGSSFNSEASGFYTNSEDTEMPDVGQRL